MIMLGGRVHSPDGPATAVVTAGSRIIFVGDDRGALDAAGQLGDADRATVHLGGRLLTAAFVDAHVHLIQTGQVMAGIDLHDARSREDVLERVRVYAAGHPDAGVIVGQGWDDRAWPDPRPPTRAELDHAAGATPVYLARVDVHSAVVSSALLAELPDLTALAGYRDDGWLTRDAHHACRGQMDRLFTDAQRRAAARTALRAAAGLGIGTVHELGGPHLGPLQDLVRVREVAAELGLDVVTYWGELASAEALDRAHSVGAAGLAGDLCIDGALGSRTAALHEPYADADSRGVRYLSDTEIADHVIACTEAGLQAGFHCIGDDAVAAAVRGLRTAAARLGAQRVRAARHRLEHVEMVDPADIDVLAELDVAASMQPGFDAAWGGPGSLYDQRVGPERAGRMNPVGRLDRAGVRLAFGTDAPVTPLAGWATVRAAVRHWRADERLTVARALAACTVEAHRAARVDDAGLVRPGWSASLALWDVPDDDLEPGTGLPRLEPQAALPTCAALWVRGRLVRGTDETSPVAR
jgi:predicted amidohydrolase YtcJ